MRRGTLIFLFFVIIVAVIVGASLFLQNQPPIEYTVAVNPLVADWARAAVNAYNDTQPVINATQRIQFTVTVTDDIPTWQGNTDWTPENHPAAWIPAAGVSIDYQGRYEPVVASLARTPLVWGGYESRVQVATASETNPFDWSAVQNAAVAEAWANLPGGQQGWRFVQLGFSRPDQTMSGLGVLFTAAAFYSESADIGGGVTRSGDYRDWLTPVIDSVSSFQTLGADPASAMARGPSTVEIALLPESQWLLNYNGLTGNEPVAFAYPVYQFMLDFPLAAWANEAETDPTERAAVEALGAWLGDSTRQAQLLDFGLRPAAGEPDEAAALFAAALDAGILYQPDFGEPIIAPARNEAQGLVQWFSNSQRR